MHKPKSAPSVKEGADTIDFIKECKLLLQVYSAKHTQAQSFAKYTLGNLVLKNQMVK